MQFLFLTIIFIILFAVFWYYSNNIIDITSYSIDSDKPDKSFKIIHLSDFHSRPFNAVLKKVKELSPDIICITGDYINDKCKNKDKMLEYGKKLVSIAPVIYITGNHERRLDNFENIMNDLSNIGFKVLLNETYENEYCTFLGLDEQQANFEDYKARRKGKFIYKDMSKYFSILDEHKGFKVVLSHFPENFKKIDELNYSQYDFDIQLSGHAHGGQWILPLVGPVFSPGQGLFPKYAKGSFGKRPMLIVSRGLGNSEFPLRIFNHPEIIEINVNSKKSF